MENNRTAGPLALEKAALWSREKLRKFSVPILATFLFGALAYFFAFTNKLINHDDVSALFTKGASSVIGRWGLEILDKFLPNYSMPWLNGSLAIVLMAIAVCLVISLFRIRSKVLQVLLAGVMVVFPSMIGVFPYMFMGTTYAAGILLSILSVWMISTRPKQLWLFAVGFLVFSVSTYQGHIAIAASLLVLVLIRQLLLEENVLPVIKRGFFFVGFLIVSLGLYYIATLVLLRWMGIEMATYASGSMSFSIANFPADIAEAYSTFVLYFKESYLGLVPTAMSRGIHLVILLTIAVSLVLWGISHKGKNLPRFLMLAAMLVLLPLAINCMHLFATRDSIHTLVLYSFVSVYVLAAVLCETCMSLDIGGKLPSLLRSITLNVATLAIALVIILNTFVANEAYLNLYLRYENAYAFYTALLADLKMMPEFAEDTKLAIIGSYDQPDYYAEKFDVTHNITGTYGFLPDSYSKDLFLEYFIGLSIPFASEEEIAQIRFSEEYKAMAVYPYYGSMQMFDDILVVKLS